MRKILLLLVAFLVCGVCLADEAVFDFSTKEGIAALGIELPELNTKDGSATNLTDQTLTSNGVSMSITTAKDKVESRLWRSNKDVTDFRIYKTSSFTLTAPAGKNITSIVMVGAAVKDFTVDGGTFKSGTWNGEQNSVTFTSTGTEKISTITVTFGGSATVQAPEISFNDATNTVTITDPSGDDNSIFYTLDGSAPDNNSTLYDGPFTIDQTTTVKAVCYGNDDTKSGVTEYLCRVETRYETIASLLSECTATSSKDAPTLTFTFSDVLVTGAAGSNVFISDATGSFLLYGQNSGLKKGDRISGSVKGALYAYNGLPEISVSDKWANVTIVSEDNEVPLTVVNAADMTVSDASKYVSIGHAHFVSQAESGKHINYVFEQDGFEFNLYDNFDVLKDITFTSDESTTYNLRVFVIPYKENIQYYAVSADDVIESTIVSYNVTVTSQDSKLGEVTGGGEVLSGETATITATANEGCHFVCWKDGDTVFSTENPYTFTPDKDITLTAVFERNQYVVNFLDYDETPIFTKTLEYGSTITAPQDPSREGYTFTGWTPEVDETVPDHDVTYTAQYSINSYTLTYILDGEEYNKETYEYQAEITPLEDPTKEGYTFSGWSEIPTTMPAHDVTVKGSFTVNGYLVQFLDWDESVIISNTLEYGSTITAPEDPSREGYTFTGWTPEVDATVPNHDVTYTAQYSINSYTLTYILDDAEYKKETYEYQAEITPLDEPTKEGYTFSGWSEIPSTMPAQDVTIKGSFTVNGYLVKFLDWDESVIVSNTLEYGSTITAPDDPIREGYTFTGWTPEVDATVPNHDVTYTAQYTINSYTLTYILDDAEYKKETYEYQAEITPLDDPTKEGYTFSGWSEIPTTMPADDVIVTGSFTVNGHLVQFLDWDESVIISNTLDFGSTITAPEDPTREGYTFTGWTPEVDATVPNHDVTYTAQYSINSYTLTYILDGEEYKKETYEYQAEITPLEEPTKEGYTFSGWSEIPSTMPAHDVTITGSFTVNGYLVQFLDWDESVIISNTLEYGSTITAPENPSREGYTFTGWTPEVDATVPTHDVTYTAQYSINSYTLTYILDDSEYKKETYEYQAEITPEPAPTKEGYTFSGWSEIPTTMPAHDVIVTGSFVVNTYTVSYYVGEELVKTFEVAYGDSIPEYGYTPEEARYTFLGWDGETYDTMPAHDVEYHAQIVDHIDTFLADSNQVEIYTLQGHLVTRTTLPMTRDSLLTTHPSLPTGIYIIKSGTKTYKVKL